MMFFNPSQTSSNPRRADLPSDKGSKLGVSALLLAACFSLTACYTTYQAPSSGPTARIEFIDSTPEHLSVHLHNGVKECTDRVNAGGVPGNSRRTISVPAGKPLVFTVGVDSDYAKMALFLPIGFAVGMYSSGLKCDLPDCQMPVTRQIFVGCAPTIEFTPQNGHDYVFHMASNKKDCTFDFFDATGAGTKLSKAPAVAFVQREWVRGFSEAGPFCKPKP